jgi:hypothetical protein
MHLLLLLIVIALGVRAAGGVDGCLQLIGLLVILGALWLVVCLG